MKVLIYDDNLDDIQILKNHLNSYAALNSIKFDIYTCPSKQYLLKNINQYDILFLDIELNEENGIDLGLELNKINNSCRIVITSSYGIYAIQGYKVHADAYFLKPLNPIEFNIELEELISWITEKYDGFFEKSISNKKILYNSIIYIDVYDRKTRIHFTNSKKISTSFTMKEWEQRLKSDVFFKIHKSFIINLSYVSGFSSRDVFMSNGESLPISRNYKISFKKKYTELLSR